jgi:hypothetical protein
MSGMLTQLAAATANNGTSRPMMPADRAGEELIILLHPMPYAICHKRCMYHMYRRC